MIIKNSNPGATVHARITAVNSVAIFVLSVCFAIASLTGCAHASSYETELSRQIGAAKTATTLFELALGQAASACEAKPVDACRSLPEAYLVLARAKQAIALADANKGELADALTAIEQLAGIVDAARAGTEE